MSNIKLGGTDWAAMRTIRESDVQLSERTFSLIFSGTLLWGFLLNYLLVQWLQEPILRMMYSGKSSGMMIGLVIGYFVLCLIGSFMLNGPTVAGNFIGFNLIAIPVGVVLSVALTAYAGQGDLVSRAIVLTISITAIMMSLAMFFPRFFQGIGPILGISLAVTLVVEIIASIFFHEHFGFTDYIVAGLMCLYIGFDWGRMTTCSRTARNAISIAASLYLDIINLFLRILSILAKKKD